MTFRERRGHRGRKTRMKRAKGEESFCHVYQPICSVCSKCHFSDITLHIIMLSGFAGTEIILCHVATIRRTVNNGPVREGER